MKKTIRYIRRLIFLAKFDFQHRNNPDVRTLADYERARILRESLSDCHKEYLEDFINFIRHNYPTDYISMYLAFDEYQRGN